MRPTARHARATVLLRRRLPGPGPGRPSGAEASVRRRPTPSTAWFLVARAADGSRRRLTCQEWPMKSMILSLRSLAVAAVLSVLFLVPAAALAQDHDHDQDDHHGASEANLIVPDLNGENDDITIAGFDPINLLMFGLLVCALGLA